MKMTIGRKGNKGEGQINNMDHTVHIHILVTKQGWNNVGPDMQRGKDYQIERMNWTICSCVII
jgi:hypothetical protein